MSNKQLSASMTASELLQGYVDPANLPDLKIEGITSDSRQVKKGDIFIAHAGLTRHAIDFVPDAVKAGAVAILVDENDPYSQQRIPLLSKQINTQWIFLPDLQKVTGAIASRFYGYPSQACKLVGITGTDGKTSVTHLLVQALTRLNEKVGSIGTLGYGVSNRLSMTSFTTPDAVALQFILSQLMQQGCEYVVMEVSSHALEQYRVSGCEFDIALLTNLGSDHLDYHGTLEHYVAAKSSLFALEELSGRVFNANDGLGRKLLQQYQSSRTLSFNAKSDQLVVADVSLKQSQMNAEGLAITASTKLGEIKIQSALVGAFNIDNLLACISVMQLLGFDAEQIEYSLQDIKAIPGRMEYYPPQQDQSAVVIDFAHTEQALEACLSSLQDNYQGELYCVFGCGGDRDQSKRPKMATVAERLADHVILTDDNPRTESPQLIMQEIMSGFQNPAQVRVIHDRKTAIETAISQANPNDLVVIAGKGHEQIQIIGDQRVPFSDRQVVQEIREGAVK